MFSNLNGPPMIFGAILGSRVHQHRIRATRQPSGLENQHHHIRGARGLLGGVCGYVGRLRGSALALREERSPRGVNLWSQLARPEITAAIQGWFETRSGGLQYLR